MKEAGEGSEVKGKVVMVMGRAAVVMGSGKGTSGDAEVVGDIEVTGATWQNKTVTTWAATSIKLRAQEVIRGRGGKGGISLR